MNINLKKLTHVGKKVGGDQDGAIYGKYLFSMNTKAEVNVYDIEAFGDVCYYSDEHGNLYIMDFDIQA